MKINNSDGIERLKSFTNININGCWIWQKATDKNGYGKIRWKRKDWRSHRLSYFLHNGTLDISALVCHKCDTPACINPGHLFLGTIADNNKDMKIKGRYNHVAGSAHGRAKLTEQQVKEIRAMLKNGANKTETAKQFGITTAMLWCIRTNKNWRHVA